MFKTTITPHDTQVHISIPKSYVGKEVEIEVKKKQAKPVKQPKNKISELRGKLHFTEEQRRDFDAYIKATRAEWERSI